ncbi:hypothetical protein H0H92_014222, partial [Tricholoma furcatifolium]
MHNELTCSLAVSVLCKPGYGEVTVGEGTGERASLVAAIWVKREASSFRRSGVGYVWMSTGAGAAGAAAAAAGGGGGGVAGTEGVGTYAGGGGGGRG